MKKIILAGLGLGLTTVLLIGKTISQKGEIKALKDTNASLTNELEKKNWQLGKQFKEFHS